MKANELCVGDWVQTRSCTIQGEDRLSPPMRVCSLGEDWVCTRIDPEQGDPFDDKIEDVRPIPLTPDILLANGFEAIGSRKFRWEGEDDNMLASIDAKVRDDGTIYIDIFALEHGPCIPVPYVHTLQHALRLAGIEKEIKL